MILTKTIKANAIKCAVRDEIEKYLKENKISLYYDRDWTISKETKNICWEHIESFKIESKYGDFPCSGIVLLYRYRGNSLYHIIDVTLHETPTYHMLQYEKALKTRLHTYEEYKSKLNELKAQLEELKNNI